MLTPTQARQTILAHFQRMGLPPQCHGVRCILAQYDDEDTLHFLKAEDPALTLADQQLLNAAAQEELQRRGASVQFVPVSIADYFTWIGRFKLDNTPANRAQYIAWTTAAEPKPQPIPDHAQHKD